MSVEHLGNTRPKRKPYHIVEYFLRHINFKGYSCSSFNDGFYSYAKCIARWTQDYSAIELLISPNHVGSRTTHRHINALYDVLEGRWRLDFPVTIPPLIYVYKGESILDKNPNIP